MTEEKQPQFILVNKPESWTSFDVVGFIRKRVRQTHPELKKIKVGHAGTLDPFATGLLIVGIGREATKRLDEFKGLPKTYEATIMLGATSTTLDKTGEITPYPTTTREAPPTETEIKAVLNTFIGLQHQIPPMYSAKKINGERLYKLARQGQEVERKPIEIFIYDIKLIKAAWPELTISVTCSAGTYIRTLAADIGDKLNTGAYCKELTRTAIGPYLLADATSPEESVL